jgi:hypothetical protein
VNVADRRRGEGLAAVRAATLVALVLPLGAVVDQAPLAGAVFSAAPELGVEGVQDLGVEAADLHLAEQRPDVVLHVRLIELQRVRRALELVQVALQQLIERRACLRVPALVDLVHEPDAGGLRLACGVRPRLDDLNQLVPALGQRIEAGVDADP